MSGINNEFEYFPINKEMLSQLFSRLTFKTVP